MPGFISQHSAHAPHVDTSVQVKERPFTTCRNQKSGSSSTGWYFSTLKLSRHGSRQYYDMNFWIHGLISEGFESNIVMVRLKPTLIYQRGHSILDLFLLDHGMRLKWAPLHRPMLPHFLKVNRPLIQIRGFGPSKDASPDSYPQPYTHGPISYPFSIIIPICHWISSFPKPSNIFLRYPQYILLPHFRLESSSGGNWIWRHHNWYSFNPHFYMIQTLGSPN